MAIGKETIQNAVQPKHSKESLLGSKRYAERRDLLGVLLEDGKEYTSAEVERKIEEYEGRNI